MANLDIIEPILRKSPDSTVFEDSFGWSIVLHQVEEPDIGDFNSFINNTRYSKITDNSVQVGVLYFCNYGSESTLLLPGLHLGEVNFTPFLGTKAFLSR